MQLPQTDVDQLTYKPTGNPGYYNWGPSTQYGPTNNNGAVCYDVENTVDDNSGGCSTGDAAGTSEFLTPWFYFRSNSFND